MEFQQVQECLLEVFTVYRPNQQGIPRKYLVRPNGIGVFEHNSMRTVEALADPDKEVIWFNALHLLGTQFIQQKMQGHTTPVVSRPVNTPVKPRPDRRTISVTEPLPQTPVRQPLRRPGRPVHIGLLDTSASPTPRVPHAASPDPKGLPQNFTLISAETKEVSLEVARDVVDEMHSCDTSQAALKRAVQQLTVKCPAFAWQIKALPVGLLFGSPRVVLTDAHNIFVVTGTKARPQLQPLSHKPRASQITSEPVNNWVFVEKTSFTPLFTDHFTRTLESELKRGPVEDALATVLHALPETSHWQIAPHTGAFPRQKHIVFTLRGRGYALTQGDPRHGFKGRTDLPRHTHVGLPNVDNSTYQNCVLQCLAHTPAFIACLEAAQPVQRDVFSTDKPFGRSLKDLLQNIRRGDREHAAENLHKVRRYLARVSPMWANGSVQDCRNFLEAVLGELAEDAPRCIDLFYGTRSVLSQYSCGVKLERPEHFSVVRVHNGDVQQVIGQMLSLQTKEKEQCPMHNAVETCRKTYRPESLPQVLVLVAHNNTLDLSSAERIRVADTDYRLCAVATNRDGPHKMHPVAVCKVENIWEVFDDSEVDFVSESQLSHVLMLFYEKVSKK